MMVFLKHVGTMTNNGIKDYPQESVCRCLHPQHTSRDKSKWLTADYLDNLLDLIFHKVFQNPVPYVNEVLKISIPEDLSAKYEKHDKQEVIASYVSIKGRSEPCITSLSIREHSAYLENHAGGQDHSDSPAVIAPATANKASYGY
ncbi:unnamed protein product [Pleuronectes platessa]|uniref:Uncharacterized protein n=1 Tax=Pleuronectes platessa TaxID=8262 RepID=A0A9N7YTW8_PLEPL|nr:unnamed protein product [Pleuronectes platessa]